MFSYMFSTQLSITPGWAKEAVRANVGKESRNERWSQKKGDRMRGEGMKEEWEVDMKWKKKKKAEFRRADRTAVHVQSWKPLCEAVLKHSSASSEMLTSAC